MFNRNSTVGFLGDSITASGRWIYEIYDYLKADRLRIFNCARSGMSAGEAVRRIIDTCFVYNPNYVVVMYGMNDIGRTFYSDSCTLPDKEQRKADAIEIYAENMHRLYDICENFGAEIILCSPTAYDTSDSLASENLNCDVGLDKCTEIVKSLAEEKGCRFIDFHTPMKELVGRDIYTNPDRVHPNPHGEHIMAQIFLKELGIIDKMNFDGSYKFGKELQELFDVSNILRGIAFVERSEDISNALDKKLDLVARKNIIKAKYEAEADKNGWFAYVYKLYIDTIDYKEDYQKLYIEKMLAFLA